MESALVSNTGLTQLALYDKNVGGTLGTVGKAGVGIQVLFIFYER